MSPPNDPPLPPNAVDRLGDGALPWSGQVRRKVDEIAALVNFNVDEAELAANTWADQFKEVRGLPSD